MISLKQNQIQGYMAKLYSRGKQYGWNAPLRLIKEGIPTHIQRCISGGPFSSFGNIVTNITENKPCLLPFESRNSIITGYDQNSFFARQTKNPLLAVRDAFGGSFFCLTGMNGEEDVEINTYAQYNDVAIYLNSIKTVAEVRAEMGSTWHTIEPITVSGAQERDYTFRNGAHTETADVYTTMFQHAMVVKGKVVGTLGEAQTGTFDFTADECNTYDNWLVVDVSQLYVRKGGSKEPRVLLEEYEKFLPKLMYQCDKIGAIRSVNRTNDRNLFFKPNTWGMQDADRACTAYGYVTIPCWGVPNGKPIKQWDASPIPDDFDCVFGMYPSVQPNGYSLGASHHRWLPDDLWLRGYFNEMLSELLNINETSLEQTGAGYMITYNQSGASEKKLGWIAPPLGASIQSSILTDIYGAVQLMVVPKIEFKNVNRQSVVATGLYGTGAATPVTTSAYMGLGGAFTYGGCRTIMAFPDKQHIIDFFKDWGIFATEDIDEVLTTDNPDSPDDPWQPEGFGPWDPNADPEDPWDNPTPKDPNNPDGPIVDYDPTNPGVDPLPPTPALISPSGGSKSYILTSGIAEKTQSWLLGDNFWNDSSNLFTNKLSAINALTLFPFDVHAHDPNSASPTSNLDIAGATLLFDPNVEARPYVMGPNFDARVRGGQIVYGTDWKSIHGTYRAFSNATYSVYVPFVGMVQVPASACIYRTLVLDYAVDWISGQATAIITSRSSTDNGYIVSITPCQMGLCVPLYSDNYTQRSWAIMTGIIGGAINGAQGNFSLGGASGKSDSTSSPVTEKGAGAGKGVGAGKGAGAAGAGLAVAGAALGAVVGGVTGGIDAAVANPIEFSHTGSVSPMNSWAVGLTPQLVITEQVPAVPNGYEYLVGQPTAQRGTLFKFSRGNTNYVEAYATKLALNATSEEMSMINETLKRGVFI